MSSTNNNMKSIATFCSYIPFEIIYAAGLNPTRIVGNGKSNRITAKAIFPTYMCSFAINCMEEFCENSKSFSGAVLANSCHPMEGIYECLAKLTNDVPIFMLNVPKDLSDDAIEYFCTELKRFVCFLELSFSINITEEMLRNAIKRYNHKRFLREKLDKLIIQQKIFLKSSDIVSLNNKFNNNAEDFEEYAETIIKTAENDIDKKNPRIMLSGNSYVPIDIVHIVEEYGGNVVFSDNCNSYRNTALYVNEKIDPIMAISQSYLNKLACARQCNIEKKMEIFERYLYKYKIDAVILCVIKFCTDQSYWSVSLADLLREKGIPFLFIDSDYMYTASGQIHTRIQAFLENL